MEFTVSLEERFWSPKGWPELPPDCQIFRIVARFEGVATSLGIIGSRNSQAGQPRNWKELKGTSWQWATGNQDEWRLTYYFLDLPTGHQDYPSLTTAYEAAKKHVMSDLFSKAWGGRGTADVRFGHARPVRVQLQLER